MPNSVEKYNGTVTTRFIPNIVAVDEEFHTVPAGGTLLDLLNVIGLPAFVIKQELVRVSINGVPIYAELWGKIYPHADSVITVQLVPAGGGGEGGKNPLRTIATIAVIVAATVVTGGAFAAAGAGAGALFTAGTTSAALAGAAVAVAGNLLVNSLFPPPQPQLSDRIGQDETQSPTLSITANNNIRQFGPIARVYGRRRIFPNFAANPYTENVGEDQYLHLLFCAGYGPLEFADYRIGDTLIGQYRDVQMEVRQGYDNDAPITIYRNDQNTTPYNIVIKQVDGYITREVAEEADELIVDFTFNGLTEINDDGKRLKRDVHVQLQWREIGGVWKTVPGQLEQSGISDVTLLQAPASENFSIYRTDLPVGSGVKLQLTTHGIYQTTAGFSRMWGSKYKVETRMEGDTNWRLQFDHNEWLREGGTEDIYLLAHEFNKRMEIRITRTDVAVYPNEPMAASNGGGFTAVPPPLLWEYTSLKSTTGNVIFSGKSTQAVRRSVRIVTGNPVAHEIRVRRITTDSDSEQILDELYLTTVRSIRYTSPVNKKGMALIALRIRASDQLNGTVDNFNCIATSILPVYRNGVWNEEPTRNPAWIAWDIMTGKVAGKYKIPYSAMDVDAFESLAAECDAQPPIIDPDLGAGVVTSSGEKYYFYDNVVDYRTTFDALVQEVLQVCRAGLTVPDGRRSITRDEPKSKSHVFTPTNSFGFRGVISYDDMPHALRVRFRNEKLNWQNDEMIVYRDGYNEANAESFTAIELPGVTRRVQVWRTARYRLAEMECRRGTYTVGTDIEHLPCTVGDKVDAASDVISVGLGSAYLKQVIGDALGQGLSLKIGQQIYLEPGKNYGIRIRLRNGSVYVQQIATPVDAGLYSEFTPTVPIPAAIRPVQGDLVNVGELGVDTIPAVIKSIDYAGDHKATITMVDYAEKIFTADSQALAPSVFVGPELRIPPFVNNLKVLEEVFTDGIDPHISLTLSWFKPKGVTVHEYEVYIFDEERGNFRLLTITNSLSMRYEDDNLQQGDVVIFAVTAIGAAGGLYKLPPTNARQVQHLVMTNLNRLPPATVQNFRLSIIGENARFTWDRNKGSDLNGYRMRYTPNVIDPQWKSSSPLQKELISRESNSETLAYRKGAYLIKAVDVYGVESEDVAIIISNIDTQNVNVVATLTESPAFAGNRNNVAVLNNALVLESTSLWDAHADFDAIPDVDFGDGKIASMGIYNFENTFDLGGVYTSRLVANVQASAVDVDDQVDDIEDVDAVDKWDGGGDFGDNWNFILQVRTTDDDPNAAPTWTEWQEFEVGEYRARAFEFRLVLESLEAGVTPAISNLSVSIDMPDRLDSKNDLVSNAGPTNVAFNIVFKETPSIVVTPQSLNTGDYFEITSKTNAGFTLQFFDATGTPIVKTFDYHAKGYGVGT